MSLEKKRIKEEKLNAIKKSFQEGTYNSLMKIFKSIDLVNKQKIFLLWAENHKRTVFFITISFLFLLFVATVFFRPTTSFQQVYDAEIENSGISDSTLNRKMDADALMKDSKLNELIKVYQVKQTLKSLREKKSLTREDSLTIKELYRTMNNLKD